MIEVSTQYSKEIHPQIVRGLVASPIPQNEPITTQQLFKVILDASLAVERDDYLDCDDTVVVMDDGDVMGFGINSPLRESDVYNTAWFSMPRDPNGMKLMNMNLDKKMEK